MSPNAPHKIGLKSIVYLKKVEKYLRIGRKRKNKKVKKSGNSGFKEFPRPLKDLLGGGLELLNCEDFSDENRFRIGGSPIIEENKTIRQELQFSLFDKYKNEMLLVFKDER